VVKHLLKYPSCSDNCIYLRFRLHKVSLQCFLNLHQFLRVLEVWFFFIKYYFIVILAFKSKHFPKQILSPFNTVNSFFREHFQCANRNLLVLFRIILTCIRFSFEWNYALYMSFWSKCSRVNEWHSPTHTSLINVNSCLNAIKSISNYWLSFKEWLWIDMRCLLMNSVHPCINMVLQRRVYY
jgi:hypothetical protein